MKRYFDLNTNTDNNFCDVIDPSYMVEIPNDGKPYGVRNGVVICLENDPEYIAEQEAIAKQSLVKEYADIFKEFDRICGAKFSRGLCTTNQIIAQRTTLQNELTQKIQEINNG